MAKTGSSGTSTGGRARIWTLRVGLLVGLVGVSGLTGCTREVPPDPTPPVEMPAPTPTPTDEQPDEGEPVPPTRPAAMEAEDEAGAVAAAEYFLELFAYTMATGDLEEWDAISASTCGFCTNVLEDTAAAYEAGGRYTGGTIEVAAGKLLGHEPVIEVFTVRVPFVLDAQTELDAAGNVVEHLDGEDSVAVVDVVIGPQGWMLLGAASEEDAA